MACTGSRQGSPPRRIALSYTLAVCLLGAFPASTAQAGGRSQGVVVVVNEDSWASLAVANEFIRLRNIPPLNVIYLPLGDLADFEIVDVETFRSRILGPVLGSIHARGLDATVDCIAWSADLPYAVTVTKDTPGLKLPAVITQLASINGLTYLCQSVMSREPAHYLSLGANWYARRVIRTAAQNDPRWSGLQMEQFNSAIKSMRDKKWDQAEPTLRQLLATHPNSPDLHYNLACCLAQLGKIDDGLAELRLAVQRGWWERLRTESDDELKPLRSHKDFAAILAEIKPLGAERIQKPRGFRGCYQWRMDGELALNLPGPRYLLSTMLAVTSGRGNSVEEGMASLRRAAAADGTRPAGTIYYMVNEDIRSKTRQPAFEAAVARLAELSVKAEIVRGIMPEKRRDVAGIMAGSAAFEWGKFGSEILPGAICEHLTSTGGEMIQQAGQTPISEWIHHGAAGTSGAVTEPYAIANKFPTPFIHYYYAGGCTLAESFYQSLAGPYQLLIVGDPLCRPWAKIPKIKLNGLNSSESQKGEIALQPVLADPNGPSATEFEFFLDGHRIGACSPEKQFTLNSREFCNGWHELRTSATLADGVETQGELVTSLFIANSQTPSLTVATETPQPLLGQPVVFTLNCPGAAGMVLASNGRELATIKGPEGQARIDTRRLGIGKVRVQVLVQNEQGGISFAAQPMELEVIPPPPLPPRDVKWETLKTGIRITPAGKESKSVNNLKQLADAGVKKDEPFVVECWFNVPETGLYQVQTHVPGQVKVQVDSQTLEAGRTGLEWQFLPITLARGVHQLRCEVTLKELRMDIRLGGPGSRSIAAPGVRH